MPHVATSPADLLATLAGSAHLDGDRLVIDDEAALPRRRPSADLAWTAAFTDGRGHDRGRPVARLGGEPGARRPLGEHPGRCTRPAPAARSPASPSRRSTSAPRPSTWRGPSTRPPPRADVGAVILELARSEQTYTFQRPIDYATSVLAGAIAAGWQRPGLHPGRPLPVQRQEVRRRPRGDDRGDPPRLPPGDRRRLPQHRHRLAPRWSTCRKPNVDEEQRENYRRAAELTALIRDARDGRRDGQRRRRDRRGRQAELDRRGAARPTSTATAASSTRWRPARTGISKVSVQTGT